MIEVGFSIILGFSIASTLCGVVVDGSRGDRTLMRGLGYLVLLSFLIGLARNEGGSLLSHARGLVLISFMEQIGWLMVGAAFAILMQLVAEGHIYDLWIRLHPQSAPTPEARFRQNAQPRGRVQPVSATLVGTSTEYLKAELDLRTDTLIKLCFYTFEDRGALTLSRLEANLRLGTGQRQKAYHKLAASLPKRPRLKPTLHRYLRSVNGSSRMSQLLFGELCCLAQSTGNRDASTLGRLSQTGLGLGLSDDEVRRLMSGAR